MMKHVIQCVRLILIAIALMTAVSCSTIKSNRYLKNRVLDLADIFTVELTHGPGLHGFLRATDFFGIGLGFSEQRGYRLMGRYVGSGKRVGYGLLFISGSGYVYYKDTFIDSCWTILGEKPDRESVQKYFFDSQGPDFWFFAFLPGASGAGWRLYGKEDFTKRWQRSLDLGVDASAYLGFHLGLSPGELLDFLIGWTTLDIVGDDSPAAPLPDTEASHTT